MGLGAESKVDLTGLISPQVLLVPCPCGTETHPGLVFGPRLDIERSQWACRMPSELYEMTPSRVPSMDDFTIGRI